MLEVSPPDTRGLGGNPRGGLEGSRGCHGTAQGDDQRHSIGWRSMSQMFQNNLRLNSKEPSGLIIVNSGCPKAVRNGCVCFTTGEHGILRYLPC